MLPRERFGPEELLLWLTDVQLRNDRASRSHQKRREKTQSLPAGHIQATSITRRCNTSGMGSPRPPGCPGGGRPPSHIWTPMAAAARLGPQPYGGIGVFHEVGEDREAAPGQTLDFAPG